MRCLRWVAAILLLVFACARQGLVCAVPHAWNATGPLNGQSTKFEVFSSEAIQVKACMTACGCASASALSSNFRYRFQSGTPCSKTPATAVCTLGCMCNENSITCDDFCTASNPNTYKYIAGYLQYSSVKSAYVGQSVQYVDVTTVPVSVLSNMPGSLRYVSGWVVSDFNPYWNACAHGCANRGLCVQASASVTPSHSASLTASQSASPTRTPSASMSASQSPSRTASISLSSSSSATPSSSGSTSRTTSVSVSSFVSTSPTRTPTRTRTPEFTLSRSPSYSNSISVSWSKTRSITPTRSKAGDGCIYDEYYFVMEIRNLIKNATYNRNGDVTSTFNVTKTVQVAPVLLPMLQLITNLSGEHFCVGSVAPLFKDNDEGVTPARGHWFKVTIFFRSSTMSKKQAKAAMELIRIDVSRPTGVLGMNSQGAELQNVGIAEQDPSVSVVLILYVFIPILIAAVIILVHHFYKVWTNKYRVIERRESVSDSRTGRGGTELRRLHASRDAEDALERRKARERAEKRAYSKRESRRAMDESDESSATYSSSGSEDWKGLTGDDGSEKEDSQDDDDDSQSSSSSGSSDSDDESESGASESVDSQSQSEDREEGSQEDEQNAVHLDELTIHVDEDAKGDRPATFI